jgi:two-component system, OmpR family, response regulator
LAEGRVLLVDDDEAFTAVMAERMESRGLAVDSVSNGLDALKKVSGASYDAVVLDLAMPGIDGLMTLKLLLTDNPDLQVILLTGQASTEKGVEAVKLGARDFLEKPADLNKLLEKIKDARAERMLLVERKIEEKMRNILGKKGW